MRERESARTQQYEKCNVIRISKVFTSLGMSPVPEKKFIWKCVRDFNFPRLNMYSVLLLDAIVAIAGATVVRKNPILKLFVFNFQFDVAQGMRCHR